MVSDGHRETPTSRSATAVRARPSESESDALRSAALLALANRLATAELPPTRTRLKVWWAAVAAVAALVAAGLAFRLASAGDEPAKSAGGAQAASHVPPATTAPTGRGNPPRTATSAPEPAATAVAPPRPSPATDGDLPDNYVIYRDGTLSLHGSVTNQRMADAEMARLVSVLPAERVLGRFAVDRQAGSPTGLAIIDAGIVFPRDARNLPEESRSELDVLVAVMKLYPRVTLEVTGHTDSEGSEEYNLKLSMSRAEGVVGYLEHEGIEPSRLTAIGKGEAEPIAENTTSAGRARNRRIDIRSPNPLDR